MLNMDISEISVWVWSLRHAPSSPVGQHTEHEPFNRDHTGHTQTASGNITMSESALVSNFDKSDTGSTIIGSDRSLRSLGGTTVAETEAAGAGQVWSATDADDDPGNFDADSGIGGDDDDLGPHDGDSGVGDANSSTIPWDPEEAETLITLDQEDMDFANIGCRMLNIDQHPPVPPRGKFLDLGSGNGEWATKMGDQCPAAIIEGMDTNEFYLPQWMTPNVQFFVGDFYDRWEKEVDDYDFVHVRDMTTDAQDWPKLVKRCHELLRPGGSVEIITFGPTLYYHGVRLTFAEGLVPEIPENIRAKHDITKEEIMNVLSAAIILDTFVQEYRKKEWLLDPEDEILRKAGFIDVETTRHLIPLNTNSCASKEEQKFSKEYYRRLRAMQTSLGLKLRPEITVPIAKLSRIKGIALEVTVIYGISSESSSSS
uniref:Methyltransferase domain-containing protein n=1 Tax=Bionectria ochroleuca TaxID=29856 RepID=A0A8H7K5D1_BIOOC